jgi:ribosomal protein S18 acetylase RimI-like enzyme
MDRIRTGRLDADVAPCVALWLTAVTERDGAIADPAALAERMTGKFGQPILRFAVAEPDAPPAAEADATDPPIAGFAVTVLRPRPDGSEVAFLEMLAVAPDQAGRGLGRTLLADALAASERLGHPWLELQVRDGNAAALALYRSAGFAQVGDPEPHPHGGAPMITMTTRP